MNIAGWMLAWKIVMVAGLVMFTIMSVWIIKAGYDDILSLYARLSRRHKQRLRRQSPVK